MVRRGNSLLPLPLLQKMKLESATYRYCHKAEIWEMSIQDEMQHDFRRKERYRGLRECQLGNPITKFELIENNPLVSLKQHGRLEHEKFLYSLEG